MTITVEEIFYRNFKLSKVQSRDEYLAINKKYYTHACFHYQIVTERNGKYSMTRNGIEFMNDFILLWVIYTLKFTLNFRAITPTYVFIVFKFYGLIQPEKNA